MEKTSKIKTCTFTKEWQGQNGVVYYHDLTLDNGDKGSIGAKEKNPSKLSVGSELTYTLADGKIKAIAPIKVGKPGFAREPFEEKMSGMAMSYAVQLIVADKVGVDKLEQTFNKIHSLLISKKTN